MNIIFHFFILPSFLIFSLLLLGWYSSNGLTSSSKSSSQHQEKWNLRQKKGRVSFIGISIGHWLCYCRRFLISEFKLGKSLGEGTFGEVRLAELKSDNTQVAIKVKWYGGSYRNPFGFQKIPKKKLTKPNQPYMITEIKNQVAIG